MPGRLISSITTAAVLCVLLSMPAGASAASYHPCKPVKDPYAGTRYEGVDLTRIRALRVGCATARRVARRAHAKALGITPPVSGIRRFTWHSWTVTGNLRGAHDRYVAARGSKRVRWRF